MKALGNGEEFSLRRVGVKRRGELVVIQGVIQARRISTRERSKKRERFNGGGGVGGDGGSDVHVDHVHVDCG